MRAALAVVLAFTALALNARAAASARAPDTMSAGAEATAPAQPSADAGTSPPPSAPPAVQGAPDGGAVTALADGGSESDAELQREIEAAMQGSGTEGANPHAGGAPSPPEPGAPSGAPAPERGGIGAMFSNVFNPATSVNGLFLGTLNNQRNPGTGEPATGIAVQEIEAQFISNVDPYFSANVILSYEPAEGMGLEEGYVMPLASPFGLQARIGKLLIPFGRENPLHTHALPFVDRSLIGNAVFGTGQLAEPSVEVSYLLPLPWYSLLTAIAMNGDNELQFASPNPYDLAGVAALKNVFDLGDEATLEAGLSYAAGKNKALNLSQVAGGHLVFKWKPARQARDRGAEATLEGMVATRPGAPPIGGFYAFFLWRLEQTWLTGARFDYLTQPTGADPVSTRGSVILVWAPSEFSDVRLQASAGRLPGHADTVFESLLQLNFTLGAHPAHSY